MDADLPFPKEGLTPETAATEAFSKVIARVWEPHLLWLSNVDKFGRTLQLGDCVVHDLPLLRGSVKFLSANMSSAQGAPPNPISVATNGLDDPPSNRKPHFPWDAIFSQHPIAFAL